MQVLKCQRGFEILGDLPDGLVQLAEDLAVRVAAGAPARGRRCA